MSENVNVEFVLIKPDAILRGLVGKVLIEFESRGFWINSLSTRYKNEEALEKVFNGIYEEDEWREYLGKPLIGFIVTCQQEFDPERIEKFVGSFLEPQLCEAGTIRERFGLNRVDNAVNIFRSSERMEAFYDSETDRDPRREV